MLNVSEINSAIATSHRELVFMTVLGRYRAAPVGASIANPRVVRGVFDDIRVRYELKSPRRFKYREPLLLYIVGVGFIATTLAGIAS